MLSARSVLQEILDDDRSFRLFCSIAAGGEAQGGWENGRIAALLPAALDELRPKVARHGADEDKHGRIFASLLRRRGLDACPVPAAADYTMLLERRGIGLAHERLASDEPLTVADVIAYLAHSRVTEQRAAEQMALLRAHFADRADIGRAVTLVAADEERHLAYCHEELLRLAGAGHAAAVHRTLRSYARAEIRVYRDVSLAVVREMAVLLHWPPARRVALVLGVRLGFVRDLLVGRRRLVALRPPSISDPMAVAAGSPVPAQTGSRGLRRTSASSRSSSSDGSTGLTR